jgi:hypothetical protein
MITGGKGCTFTHLGKNLRKFPPRCNRLQKTLAYAEGTAYVGLVLQSHSL